LRNTIKKMAWYLLAPVLAGSDQACWIASHCYIKFWLYSCNSIQNSLTWLLARMRSPWRSGMARRTGSLQPGHSRLLSYHLRRDAQCNPMSCGTAAAKGNQIRRYDRASQISADAECLLHDGQDGRWDARTGDLRSISCGKKQHAIPHSVSNLSAGARHAAPIMRTVSPIPRAMGPGALHGQMHAWGNGCHGLP